MSIPNWVPQSPKWFNLEAIKEHNKNDFSNISFKIAHFKYVYSKNQTYIIRETKNRQAAPSPISTQRSCCPSGFLTLLHLLSLVAYCREDYL